MAQVPHDAEPPAGAGRERGQGCTVEKGKVHQENTEDG